MGIKHCPDDFYNKIIQIFNSNNGGLTLQGLYEFFMTKTIEKGEDHMRNIISALGYDRDMCSIESRAVNFTIHSAKRIQFNAWKMTEDISLKA